MDGKRTLLRGVSDLFMEHQVLHVCRRYHHPLLAGEPPRPTDVEEALDLLIDPADRLNLAALIHRTRDGE